MAGEESEGGAMAGGEGISGRDEGGGVATRSDKQAGGESAVKRRFLKMAGKDPSREFRAFYGVLCIIWGLLVINITGMSTHYMLPDDIQDHMVYGMVAGVSMWVGAIAIIFVPLYGIWYYVTEGDKE
jgi:hypothetical protein